MPTPAGSTGVSQRQLSAPIDSLRRSSHALIARVRKKIPSPQNPLPPADSYEPLPHVPFEEEPPRGLQKVLSSMSQALPRLTLLSLSLHNTRRGSEPRHAPSDHLCEESLKLIRPACLAPTSYDYAETHPTSASPPRVQFSRFSVSSKSSLESISSSYSDATSYYFTPVHSRQTSEVETCTSPGLVLEPATPTSYHTTLAWQSSSSSIVFSVSESVAPSTPTLALISPLSAISFTPAALKQQEQQQVSSSKKESSPSRLLASTPSKTFVCVQKPHSASLPSTCPASPAECPPTPDAEHSPGPSFRSAHCNVPRPLHSECSPFEKFDVAASGRSIRRGSISDISSVSEIPSGATSPGNGFVSPILSKSQSEESFRHLAYQSSSLSNPQPNDKGVAMRTNSMILNDFQLLPDPFDKLEIEPSIVGHRQEEIQSQNTSNADRMSEFFYSTPQLVYDPGEAFQDMLPSLRSLRGSSHYASFGSHDSSRPPCHSNHAEHELYTSNGSSPRELDLSASLSSRNPYEAANGDAAHIDIEMLVREPRRGQHSTEPRLYHYRDTYDENNHDAGRHHDASLATTSSEFSFEPPVHHARLTDKHQSDTADRVSFPSISGCNQQDAWLKPNAPVAMFGVPSLTDLRAAAAAAGKGNPPIEPEANSEDQPRGEHSFDSQGEGQYAFCKITTDRAPPIPPRLRRTIAQYPVPVPARKAVARRDLSVDTGISIGSANTFGSEINMSSVDLGRNLPPRPQLRRAETSFSSLETRLSETGRRKKGQTSTASGSTVSLVAERVTDGVKRRLLRSFKSGTFRHK